MPLFTTAWLLVSVLLAAEPTRPTFDPVVSRARQARATLFAQVGKAQRVEVFKVGERVPPRTSFGGPVFAGYAVEAGPIPLVGEQVEEFKRVVLDDETYPPQGILVLSGCIGCTPDVGLRVGEGPEQVEILLCFSCSQVGFATNDPFAHAPTWEGDPSGIAVSHLSGGHDRLLALAQWALPGDESLQRIDYSLKLPEAEKRLIAGESQIELFRIDGGADQGWRLPIDGGPGLQVRVTSKPVPDLADRVRRFFLDSSNFKDGRTSCEGPPTVALRFTGPRDSKGMADRLDVVVDVQCGIAQFSYWAAGESLMADSSWGWAIGNQAEILAIAAAAFPRDPYWATLRRGLGKRP